VVLGVALFVLSTVHGIGILADTTRYMQISPVPYDAPLYPWLLSLGHVTGIGLDGVAYILGLYLLMLNIALMFHILKAVTGNNLVLLGCAMLLVVLAPQFMRAHMVAMSEPLFICLTLLSAPLLTKYMDEGQGKFLIAAGVALGFAMLARFTAAPYGVAFACALLLCGGKWSLGKRIRDIFVLALISGGIFLLWAIGSKLLVGRATGRSFAFFGNPDRERWVSGLESAAAFMLPDNIPDAIRFVLVVCILALILYLSVRAWIRASVSANPARADLLAMVFGLITIWYLAFLVLAVNIEANLPINGRYLLPMYLACVIVLFSGLGRLSPGRPIQAIKVAALAAIALVIASHAVRVASQTRDAYRDGVGYQAVSWKKSPIILAVDALPKDAEIFTNAPDALNYLTGRRTNLIPTVFERRTGIEDAANPYSKQVAGLRSALQQGNAYVVFVDKLDWRFYLVAEDKLRSDAGLETVQSLSDGRIYAIK
jgi:4-amino-4-deoxy-L-arabinose transferase-like glycosyltransferase